ncbi:MAG TPA: hypothetical protein VF487_10445 [Chitinophagaceae bacterium]
MAVNLLYMNQGGGGDWGALAYADYDILCLAESNVEKEKFSERYNSLTQPPMSVQINKQSGRIITGVKDIDVTAVEVRPILTFQIVTLTVRVVFFHFKSGNEKFATQALDTAVTQYKKIINNDLRTATLWIGDYNRAQLDPLTSVFKDYQLLCKGGGISKWSLDRAIITGNWNGKPPGAEEVSRSSDNQHIGIKVSFS